MLGIHERPDDARAVPRQGSLTLVALAAFAASLFAVAGTAEAQDCVGGYRMLKGEVPVVCDDGFGPSAVAPAARLAEEPLYTGSINQGQPPAAQIDEPPAATSSGMECVGGYTWRQGVENSYTTLPLPCNRM